MKYSIVIPCYNEESNLENMVKKLKQFPRIAETEFILVENGSTDNSREVFKHLDVDEKHIKRVYVDQNKGYGYGLICGLKVATGKYVGWLHADLQVKPKELLPFIEFLETNPKENNYFLKGTRKNRSLLDRFFTGSMTVFELILFQKKMNDIGAIPVLFNHDLLKIMTKAPYDFSIELYTYYNAKLNDYIIKRFPVTLEKRSEGTSSWDKGLKSKFKQSLVIMKDSVRIRKGKEVR